MPPAKSTSEPETLDLRNLLQVLTAVKKGDFSVRMPIDYTGVEGKIADTLNEIIELNEKMVSEFSHLRTIVGKSGRITQRATLGTVYGGPKALMLSIPWSLISSNQRLKWPLLFAVLPAVILLRKSPWKSKADRFRVNF